MRKDYMKINKALIVLTFSLMTTTAFAAQVSFVDELSDSDHAQMKMVAQNVIGKVGSKATELHGFFDSLSQPNVLRSYRSQISDLIQDSKLFNKAMPSMVANGNEEDAKESFLNLLGFGGKYFDKKVDKDSALAQYLPTMHVRNVNGVKNIFFENPAFTDSLFAENINYYDSLLGLSHYVPTCVSNQKKHDKLLAYAFLGKGSKENISVKGLSDNRGKNGARLPIVELVGKYLAKKLVADQQFSAQEKLVFSGSGFAGAVAQEVAYQLAKKQKVQTANGNVKVVTAQAMRYLAGDFATDYGNVLGTNNVLSINTSRKRHLEMPGINYKSIYFNALGTQVRLETEAPTNGFFDGLFWKMGLKKDRFDENHKGVLFKTNDTPKAKVQKILGDKIPTDTITNDQFAKLTPILVDVAKGQSQTSSNALATLISGDMFLKTSKGHAEHDNLEKVRKKFGIANNVPTLVDLGNNAHMVIPASYYDPIHNVTVTVAHTAGDKSAHDNLKNILGQSDFKNAAAEKGKALGQILASLHKHTGSVSHGDFHLNNIRFDKQGKAYVIDVETLAKNYVDGNVRDSNSLRDILDLIAKTTSHIYKSSTYGASKGFLSNFFGKEPSETEKSFALAVFQGYIKSLDQESLTSLKKQYEKFKDKYKLNVNKYLSGGIFSTYNNAIFTEVFKDELVKGMLEGNPDLLKSTILTAK